jgi:hypothetical protein
MHRVLTSNQVVLSRLVHPKQWSSRLKSSMTYRLLSIILFQLRQVSVFWIYTLEKQTSIYDASCVLSTSIWRITRTPGPSYCCGDPVDPIAIECDGQKTWITQSLYSALRKIRDIMPPATLWVDALCGSLWVGALCINQSRETDGLHEREHQVQMMGCVFGNAIAVIVDLGERPRYFDGLLEVFHEITLVPEESCRAYSERGEVSEDFR